MNSPLRHLLSFDLGMVEYEDGLLLQKAFSMARGDRLQRDALLLLEHSPTITLGRSARPEHLLLSRERFAELGVKVFDVTRGGDVTCHMPGQLVAYPIFRLSPDRCDVRRYVHDLEEIMLETLAAFSIRAHRVEGSPGVFLGEPGRNLRKIGAIGIQMSRWITSHGLSLNIANNLDLFRKIVPCGQSQVSVTSMARELRRPPPFQSVKHILTQKFAQRFGAHVERGRFSLRTVSVTVLRRAADDFEVLLLKRHPNRGDYWQPITGSIERGESPSACAVRELREESGQSGHVWNLGYAHAFLFGEPKPSRLPRVFQETAFWTLVRGDAPIQIDDREHCEHAWMPWKQALDLVPHAGLRVAIIKAVKAARASFASSEEFFGGV
ncbi:MAG: lipoyl(octanoyl) transferase LipB [Myxococcales bacterium]|jgi:lipoyl(octanoyl) transferase|nr:lipoyl(octanoyl) transferase LipB [Myxococcales bacterium]